MQTWSRRRVEPIGLAILGIVSVFPLRFHVESRSWFASEVITLFIAFAVAQFSYSRSGTRRVYARTLTTAASIIGISPILYACLTRTFGSPIAYEISTLSTFGALSLAIAVATKSQRNRSLSLVVSGFLVLFSASISDDSKAVNYPILWILGCVWHLVANHWEKLDLALPDSVERSWSLRPSILLATFIFVCLSVYIVKGRYETTKQLAYGLMPTSGGSKWSDPAARSGVGSGDAAIAAKDHAESFGAVDSEIFLESTESSLFDMANEMFGDPVKIKKYEARQAIGSENVIESHEKAAKSEKGGGTFSTERLPPKQHRHLRNAKDPSVIQWDGPTGIRLGMHRYDVFDGQDWVQSRPEKTTNLRRRDIGEQPWFFAPSLRALLDRPASQISVGLLKINSLNSPRIPLPMLTAGIHIKDVDRVDLFALTEDESFFMPRRDKVPPLTVIHAASISMSEDQIRKELTADHTPEVHQRADSPISRLIQAWIQPNQEPYDIIQAVQTNLRTKFSLQLDGEEAAGSLNEFLETHRGGNHLFATTAALMLRQAGLKTRLATGFYVRPDSFDLAAGHARILPKDVHTWVEVQLNNSQWIEVEATPGYVPPDYRPSLWLLTRQFLAAKWPHLVGLSAVLCGFCLTYRYWADRTLTCIWLASRIMKPERRLILGMRIIERRGRLAGCIRPPGQSQRAWLEQLTARDSILTQAVRGFTDAADAIVFGSVQPKRSTSNIELVDLLPVRTIATLHKEATS